jgi:sugar phosphate isomerase/epimerase
MVLTGIGDEAGASLEAQINAASELGWRHLEMRFVEVPGFAKGNLHDIPEAAFDTVAGTLRDAGIEVYCFASGVANWSKNIHDPFSITLDEVRRCIPRMQKLNTKLVRIMSFKPGDAEDRIPGEIFRRVGEITKMFLDAGLQPVHENCMNYGGMSWQHGLELLEKCPGLKWVFDTGNPIFNPDRSKPKPWPRQDPWEFWEHIRDHVAHIHVKDGRFDAARNDCVYTYPGEGDGRVRDILSDAMRRGYTGWVSIEPHVASVFHDATAKTSASGAFESFVEYARKMEAMQLEIQTKVAAPPP